MKRLLLKRGKEESLRRFHPWVFSGAVQQLDEGIEEGEVVRVVTSSGDFIAVGHYQIGSIAVRVLSFRDVEIDGEFWYSRLKSALEMRRSHRHSGQSAKQHLPTGTWRGRPSAGPGH